MFQELCAPQRAKALLAPIILAILVSCGAPEPPPTQEVHPDVAILAFAGRCGFACGAPFENRTDLEATKGTISALAQPYIDGGLTVQYAEFAASVAQTMNANGAPGYYEAQQALRGLHREWVEGKGDPTKVVLLGYSHGATWATLLAAENPHIAIDRLVLIDGVCNQWEADNLRYGASAGSYEPRNLIAEFFATIPEPYPTTLEALGGACNRLAVPGVDSSQHLKDVVFPNVDLAIEVMSTVDAPLLPDSVAKELATSDSCWVDIGDANYNHRLDGSYEGLWVVEETQQNHCDVARGGGLAMRAVADWLADRMNSAETTSSSQGQMVPLEAR